MISKSIHVAANAWFCIFNLWLAFLKILSGANIDLEHQWSYLNSAPRLGAEERKKGFVFFQKAFHNCLFHVFPEVSFNNPSGGVIYLIG